MDVSAGGGGGGGGGKGARWADGVEEALFAEVAFSMCSAVEARAVARVAYLVRATFSPSRLAGSLKRLEV